MIERKVERIHHTRAIIKRVFLNNVKRTNRGRTKREDGGIQLVLFHEKIRLSN